MVGHLEDSVLSQGVCYLVLGYNHVLLEYLHGVDLSTALLLAHDHL